MTEVKPAAGLDYDKVVPDNAPVDLAAHILR